MNKKILFVDDEINVLEGIRRQLRKYQDIATCPGPEEGLREVKNNGPFAVVVSDLRMPVMDGISFLTKVREISPDTVRMILTGNADLKAAIQAVNEGSIFRFMTKPCHPEALAAAVNMGIDQYRLITSEKELLEKTLKGCINMLTDVLALVNPEAFGRSHRICGYAMEIGSIFDMPDLWRLETAALLSQIGCVVLPQQALKKIYNGDELDGQERTAYEKHPSIGQDLLSNIPRMEEVAEIIACQNYAYDGSGQHNKGLKSDAIPLGSRILKAVLDFDLLELKGHPKGMAFKQLKEKQGVYDPQVLDVFENVLGTELAYIVKEIEVKDLKSKMILGSDIEAENGTLLISKGSLVTEVLLSRLRAILENSPVREPIKVFISRSRS
jgi:response regulator RpfG family c-di-GMP phosphodiesterase